MVTDSEAENLKSTPMGHPEEGDGAIIAKEFVLVEVEVAELADRYFDLILFLKELNEDLSTSANPLEECLDAIVAVKRFLELDPIIAQSGIVRPVAMLAAVIRDVTLGAKPEFLRPTKKTGSRPRSLSGLISRQATAAACAEVLIHYGITVEEACKFVLRALEKEKLINNNGSKFVKWETIRRWREEMGSRNPPESLAIYRGIETELKRMLGPNATDNDAKKTVPNCILALKHSGTVVP